MSQLEKVTYINTWKHIINNTLLHKVLYEVYSKSTNNICPNKDLLFKVFEVCSYNSLKVVMLGMDPYPQKGIATGIMFGNNKETPEDKLSPSLEVVKEACINYELNHNPYTFDITLEDWCKQGVLLLNTALTCEVNKPGSHSLIWRPFISDFLKRLSEYNPGLVYVLFGSQAKTFKPYINNGSIIEVEHPAWFARNNKKMPYSIFTTINKLVKEKFDTAIEWYREI